MFPITSAPALRGSFFTPGAFLLQERWHARRDCGKRSAMSDLTISLIIRSLLVVGTIAAMEWVAWASHKYVMHGFGWGWHADHHEPHDGFLEKNDRFALFGTGLSIALFVLGSEWLMDDRAWWPATWLGLGVLGYGIIYTLVHDGLVHQRWFRWVPRRGYARRLIQAHKLHHATLGKEGGVSFGFLCAREPEALKRELSAQRKAGITVLRESVSSSSGASNSGASNLGTAAERGLSISESVDI
jgi:beta-carotene 3-hydroxylase